MTKIKKYLFKMAERLGLYIMPLRIMYADIKEPEFWEIYHSCKPYTLTSVENVWALLCSKTCFKQ